MLRSMLAVSLLALSFFTGATVAEPHGRRRSHDSIARRASSDVNIHKRYDSARWTFYDVGMGACGQNNVPSDFIVALNSNQFGGGYPGPNCFKMITMTYNGKTTSAQIMDECPGCPYGGLDLSTGLFQFFASESEGVIYGTWSFADGSGGGGGGATTTSSKWVEPTSTWKPLSISTSTWEPPSSTSTWEPPSSTSKWEAPSSSSTWSAPSSTWSPPASSSSSSSVSSVDYSSGPASGLAVPTGTVPTDSDNTYGSQNFFAMNQAIVGIGGLIVIGASS